MHQTRAQATKKLPIPRKGTKYVARSLIDMKNSVPVVVAVRDMLKLARTSKEVKSMIYQKVLKINGKEVKDLRDSIRLLNVFEAGKQYVLTLSNHRKFRFEETKAKERACKVINKTMLKGKLIQLNLHDGTNLQTKDKINTNDTVYLDFSGKITKHVPLEKDKSCAIISGKYVGQKGKIESIEENKALIKVANTDVTTKLNLKEIVAL